MALYKRVIGLLIRLVWFFVFAVCLWFSAREIRTWHQNREPLSLTLDTYVQKRPDVAWLSLSHCRINYTETTLVYKSGDPNSVEGYYVPVRTNFYDDSPVFVVKKIASREQIDLLEKLLSRDISEAESKKIALAHHDAFFREELISGLVIAGPGHDTPLRRKLAETRLELDPDFIVIDAGRKPTLKAGLLFLSCGLIALIIGISSFQPGKEVESNRGGEPEPDREEATPDEES